MTTIDLSRLADGALLGTYADFAPTAEGFGTPFVDEDVTTAEPRPFRIVHGGFAGTDTLFTFYLPPGELYQGRILQYLEGGAGGHENLLRANVMAFGSTAYPWQYDYAFDEMGAVLIESNQGHGPNAATGFENDIYLFGASAESARFARYLTGKIYGTEAHHTYVFGCSGGGHRSFQCIMRAPDVYAGGVPEVFGVNPGPFWSVMGQAMAVLGREDLARVRDAMEPGGSGDPFVGLTFEQRSVLADLFHMGFPRGATTQLGNMPVFPFTLYNVLEQNPAYFHQFWNERGFLGHDDPERLAGRRRKFTTTVTGINEAGELASEVFVMMQLATAGATLQTPFGATVDYDDPHSLFMAKLTVRSGKAAGREMVIATVTGKGVLLPFGERCPELFNDVEPGDEVEIDNADWLAFCHLYHHNVEWSVPGLHTDGHRVPRDFDRFALDGNPVQAQTGTSYYPLDEVVPWPGKMIYIGAVLDIAIWPAFITTFDEYVRSVLQERAGDVYRLWWVENSTHGRAEMAAMVSGNAADWRTRLVDYEAVGAAALTAVQRWAEEGIEPPADSAFSMTADKHIEVLADPLTRGGVQPAVTLTVDGGTRADVGAGQEVTFVGRAVVPVGGGTIVEAEMDFVNDDTWPFQAGDADGTATTIEVRTTHRFEQPGTYFPVLRIGSHLQGAGFQGEAVRNLCRVRVVVS